MADCTPFTDLFTGRNRVAVLALTALVAGCGGAGGNDSSSGGIGRDGSDGRTALVFVSAEAPGLTCLGGGSKVSAGLDGDGDRVLGAAEVSSVQYICNGRDGVPGSAGTTAGAAGSQGTAGPSGDSGFTGLIRTNVESASTRCSAGGLRVSVGIDANRNGVLDDNEVSSSDVVCNGFAGATGATGASGASGAAGTTGADGIGSLVLMTIEAVGPNCTAGGTRVSAGRDVNRNAVLDTSEVSSIQYVCNGSNGAAGMTGPTGAVGATGPTGAAGSAGAIGATGPTGVSGADGFTTLVLMSSEASGSNCAAGGVRVSAGRDLNRSGVLDAIEVQASDYLCKGATGAAGATGATGATGNAGNAGATGATGTTGASGASGAAGATGASGLSSLIGMVVEPAGVNCSNGGARLDSGLDGNGNGVLDSAEISATRYACNGAIGATGASGANGATGAAGTPGANGAAGASGATGAGGLNGLVAITTESSGSNCTYGGQRITAGLDSNGNGVLDAGEIATTTYVCNGVPGPGVTWTSTSSSATAVIAQANTGVLAANNSAEVVITLPATSNPGDIFRVTGLGAGGWRIAQNAGQSILTRNLPGAFIPAGIDWTDRVTSVGFSDVAGSSDGLRLAAVAAAGVYTSTNGGVSWSFLAGSPGGALSIAASADGVKLVLISGGQIYTSANSGGSWTARDSVRNWTDVASSSDGSRLVATVDNTGSGLIYVSTDSGATWTASGSPNSGWKSIAGSADGLRLVAAASAIYTSTDGGASWNLSASLQVSTVDSSSNGLVLTAVSHNSLVNEGLFVSLDAGSTWIKRLSSTDGDLTKGGWRPVKVSGDGKTIVASALGRMHVSRDMGRTWTNFGHSYLVNVRGLAISRDGSLITAAVSGGSTFGLFTSAEVGAATTTGTNGYLAGRQYDSVELQHLGGGTFIVLGYSLFSTGGLTVQ